MVLYQLTDYIYQVLSPLERYQSMRRLRTDTVQDLWNAGRLVILGWALIGLLLIILFIVRKIRLEKDRLATGMRIRKLCDKLRLTIQEREILEAICQHVTLAKKEDIFTNKKAFDTGFAGLMHESFAAGHTLKQRKQLNIIVQCIKAKLGFQSSSPTLEEDAFVPRTMSSRQIPEGRSVRVEVMLESSILCFDAKITRNDEYGLVVLPDMSVQVTPGKAAHIQYRVGTRAWVFESTVVECGSGGLELTHVEQAKVLNRRRFPRISVQKKAMVALFDMNQTVNGQIKAPNFVNAAVIEISGPGLLIQTDLEVKLHSMLLIIFEPEDGRVVQDVVEVRGFRNTDSGRSVAVEMVGLNENTVNELIRITKRIAGSAGTSFLSGESQESQIVQEKEQLV
jgi:hypothetical protein